MSNVRMTKASLLESIKDYPDDTPVVVTNRIGTVPLQPMYLYLTVNPNDDQPVVWSVSFAPDKIVLEL